MAEEKEYYIRAPEALVEVSEEVYRAYHQESRRGHTVDEEDRTQRELERKLRPTVKLA